MLRGRWGWLASLVVLATGLAILSDALPPPDLEPEDVTRPPARTVMVHGTWVPEPHAGALPFSSGRPPPRPIPGRPPALDPSHEPPAPGPSPTRKLQVHTVRSGESLWKISARYLGRGDRWQEIARANPGRNLKRILPGMELHIPARGAAPPTPVREHVVRRGETLSAIANKYYADGNWRRIFNANRDRLKDPDRVPPGVRLKIPSMSGGGRQ